MLVNPNRYTTTASPLSDQVLRLIWSERQISRAAVAREIKLARSTVSSVVASLLTTGLIREIGPGPSSGGRRPIVIEFQDDASVILGVEMGGNHLAVVLTNLRGRVLAWRQQPHLVRDDPAGTRKLIYELCDQCLHDASYSRGHLVGIGLAVPSPVDPSAPNRLSELVMPAWKGILDMDFLAEEFGAPLLVDNDANAGALAERWWGAGLHSDNFAYVKASTGVGSGHIIGGDVYRGVHGVAGEIGHLSVKPDGEACICGNHGCLTTVVGTAALLSRAKQLLAEHPNSVLAADEITVSAIENAALAGDAVAVQIVDEAAEFLGIALAGMLNLFNPSLVIIGGSLARLGEQLLQPLRVAVRKRALVSSIAGAEIRTSEMGPQAVAVGAATLVLKRALSDATHFPPVVNRSLT